MRKVIYELISLLFILLWLYTGVNKLLDYEQFRFQLGRSPFLEPVAGFVSRAVPIVELLMVAALAVKRTRLPGLYASFFTMLLFTLYIAAMLRFSYYVPCSCTGFIETMSWPQHLVFNIIFTLLALLGIILYSRVNTINNNAQPALPLK